MSIGRRIGRLSWALACFTAGLAGASCTDSPTGGDPDVVVAIEVVPGADTLVALGSEVQLVAVATNAFGEVVGGKSFSWASSNLLAARVDDAGLVTAVGNGVAVVTATADSVTGGAQISVEQAFFRFVFQPGPTDVLVGQPLGTVTVRAEDQGGSRLRDGTGTVTLTTTAGSPGGVVGGPMESGMFGGEATFPGLAVEGQGLDYRLEASWKGRSGVSSPFDVVTAFDAVAIANAPDPLIDEMGLLVDGLRTGQPLNDFPVTTLSDVAEVGVVRPAGAGGNDELIVFSPHRRLELVQDVPWTSGVDTVEVTLQAALEVDVTIWIVKGPFAAQASHAASAIARTARIWDDERAGLAFDSVAYMDATAADSASNYFDLTVCNAKAGLEANIGYVAGTINVYWVGTVDSGTRRGRACPIGGDHIIMAEDTGDELLSHEIGHSLGLTHTDAITENFDQTNVMHSASSVRRYLTEGQTFRQQFDPGSVVNSRWGMRTSEQRACPRDFAFARCPAIEARIWADGGFGPTPAAAAPTNPVERWIDVQCEMEANEGLSRTVRAMGSAAVEAFTAVAIGASPPGRAEVAAGRAVVHSRRVVALDGLAMMADLGGREVLERLAGQGPPEVRAAAAARIRR